MIYMGGAIDMPGNTTPAAEFNFWFDPESIKIALRTPFKEQIVVPDDICERVFYTKAIYDRIAARTRDDGRQDVQGAPGADVPDRSRAAVVHLGRTDRRHPPRPRPRSPRIEERFIDIDTNYGPNYGRSIGYHESRRRSLASPENFPAGTQKVKIVFDIDRNAFWNLFVGLMTRPDSPARKGHGIGEST